MQLNQAVLDKKGLQIPQAPAPVGSYVQCVRTGNLLHLSGGISVSDNSSFYGKLGRDLSVEQGQQAAVISILNRLGVIKAELCPSAPHRRNKWFRKLHP